MTQISFELADAKTFVDRVGKRSVQAVQTIQALQKSNEGMHIAALGSLLSGDVESIMKESAFLNLAKDVVNVSKDGEITPPEKLPTDEDMTKLAHRLVERIAETLQTSHSSTSMAGNLYRLMEGEAARELFRCVTTYRYF